MVDDKGHRFVLIRTFLEGDNRFKESNKRKSKSAIAMLWGERNIGSVHRAGGENWPEANREGRPCGRKVVHVHDALEAGRLGSSLEFERPSFSRHGHHVVDGSGGWRK